MQSSKTSKQSRPKTAESASKTAETTAAKEVKKSPRAPRASQVKKTLDPVPAAAKSHRKISGGAVESAKEVPVASRPLASSTSSHEEIAKLAYSYWADRNFAHGHHDEDWARAVRELSHGK